jgi:hypothetical protein
MHRRQSRASLPSPQICQAEYDPLSKLLPPLQLPQKRRRRRNAREHGLGSACAVTCSKNQPRLVVAVNEHMYASADRLCLRCLQMVLTGIQIHQFKFGPVFVHRQRSDDTAARS